MEALGYSRPTLYRYLKILKEAGFVTSMPSGGFALGPRVVELDFLMRKSDTLLRYAKPHMEAFAATWPCAALLVRWYGNKLLVVASETQTPELENGLSARKTLAAVPRRDLARHHVRAQQAEAGADYRGQPGRTRCGGDLGTDTDTVLSELRRIRRRGYAVAVDELTKGVTGIASPIFDGGKAPIGTFCITIADESAAPDVVERDRRPRARGGRGYQHASRGRPPCRRYRRELIFRISLPAQTENRLRRNRSGNQSSRRARMTR